jgi:predicted secreted protein
MYRTAGLSIVALLVGLALPPAALRAADEDKFVGVFVNTVEGYKETWTIKIEDGKWSVSGVYVKPRAKDSSFEGKDAQVTDGKLIFTQKLGDNAPPGWIDGCKVTVEATRDGNLSYVWQVGELKGAARALTRTRSASTGTTTTTTPTPKPAGDEDKFVGTFHNNVGVDGYKETWFISYADGKWEIHGAYNRLRAKPGLFKANDIKFADGKLTFTQKLGGNVPGTWIDNCRITVEQARDGNLTYVWDAGFAKGEPRPLTRAR